MLKMGNSKIVISKNGPYLVSGKLPLDKAIILADDEGQPLKWKFCDKFPEKEDYSLCRCGKSKNKPFCDGTHVDEGFNGQFSQIVFKSFLYQDIIFNVRGVLNLRFISETLR